MIVVNLTSWVRAVSSVCEVGSSAFKFFPLQHNEFYLFRQEHKSDTGTFLFSIYSDKSPSVRQYCRAEAGKFWQEPEPA